VFILGGLDDYHYPTAPMFLDSAASDILPIAFALDGFLVSGSLEPNGAPMLPLDTNNGHFDALCDYGTATYPCMIGYMVGEVEVDSQDQIVPHLRTLPIRLVLASPSGIKIFARF
jgi:hypothetical protein